MGDERVPIKRGTASQVLDEQSDRVDVVNHRFHLFFFHCFPLSFSQGNQKVVMEKPSGAGKPEILSRLVLQFPKPARASPLTFEVSLSSRWSIPMFHADFPHDTSKSVEVVPHLPFPLCNVPSAHYLRSLCEKSYRGSRMESRFLLPIPCWGSSPLR